MPFRQHIMYTERTFCMMAKYPLKMCTQRDRLSLVLHCNVLKMKLFFFVSIDQSKGWGGGVECCTQQELFCHGYTSACIEQLLT